jgi:hypothetical protein
MAPNFGENLPFRPPFQVVSGKMRDEGFVNIY